MLTAFNFNELKMQMVTCESRLSSWTAQSWRAQDRADSSLIWCDGGVGVGPIFPQREQHLQSMAEGRPSHSKTCQCFRVLKSGLIEVAEAGRFNQECRQGLQHKGSHLLVYRELSFILEAIPGWEGRMYS